MRGQPFLEGKDFKNVQSLFFKLLKICSFNFFSFRKELFCLLMSFFFSRRRKVKPFQQLQTHLELQVEGVRSRLC